MTARLAEGRAAWSEYRVLQRFEQFTLLEVRIGTGRTHQIRVHLASIGHPVAGDTLYGAKALAELHGRFFLHAHRIKFRSPATGEQVVVESPLATELEEFAESCAAPRLGQTTRNDRLSHVTSSSPARRRSGASASLLQPGEVRDRRSGWRGPPHTLRW